jgi:hypothetical protein
MTRTIRQIAELLLFFCCPDSIFCGLNVGRRFQWLRELETTLPQDIRGIERRWD